MLLFAALIVVAAVAVGGYGIWYLFLQGPGPAAWVATPPWRRFPRSAVSRQPLREFLEAAALDGPARRPGFDGTWKVDTSIGSFSDFTNSFVGYRVQEQLSGIGANTAVGRTPNVSGTITIAATRSPRPTSPPI